MELSTSDLNAQLAWMRDEFSGSYNAYWNAFKTKTTLNEATDYFASKIEGGGSLTTREVYAKNVYDLFKYY